MWANIRTHLTYANVMATIAVFAGLGGGAVAAVNSIPGPDGVIHSCYQKVTGNLRVVRAGAKCKKSEKALAFAQRGVPGPPGKNGSNGTAGVNGSNGSNGTNATRLFVHGYLSGGGVVLDNHTPGISAVRNGVGDVTVTFPQDISRCVAIGSLGADADNGGGTAYDAFETTNRISATQVEVLMFSDGGTALTQTDGPFALAELC